MIKNEIRVIGWDDCAHSSRQRRVMAVGVIFRGGKFMDGLLSVMIKKDGLDATEKIAGRITGSRHYDQLSAIMLDGITMAGFNVVDIKKLNRKTRLPVIAVQRKMPDKKRFFVAMKNLGCYKQRLKAARSAGAFYQHGNIVYQKCGLKKAECEKLLRVTTMHGNIPEPVRVAHLIASGLSGESRGRA